MVLLRFNRRTSFYVCLTYDKIIPTEDSVVRVSRCENDVSTSIQFIFLLVLLLLYAVFCLADFMFILFYGLKEGMIVRVRDNKRKKEKERERGNLIPFVCSHTYSYHGHILGF